MRSGLRPLDPPRRSAAPPPGVYTATVTRVTSQGAYVDGLGAAGIDHELGPSPVIAGPWTAGAVTESAAGPPGSAHTHGAGVDLAQGDRVLVAFLNGSRDDVAVLGRLP